MTFGTPTSLRQHAKPKQPHPRPQPQAKNTLWQHAAWSLAILAALLLWDFSGADLPMAHLAGDAQGFDLSGHWFFSGVAHDGIRRLTWLIVLALFAAVWWPVGPWRALSMGRRLELAVLPLFAGLLISTLKSFSLTSCPWDLNGFGGVAQYVSHWRFEADGGPGRCFPGGHASNGFSFLAGYFVFKDSHPALARRWLAGALAAGLLLGLVQQWRGAHFMSHTLWTGWLCWMLLWAMDAVWRKAER